MSNARYGGKRPTYQWRVMPEDQERVLFLFQELRTAEANSDTMTLERAREDLRAVPGFPRASKDGDLVEVELVRGIVSTPGSATPDLLTPPFNLLEN